MYQPTPVGDTYALLQAPPIKGRHLIRVRSLKSELLLLFLMSCFSQPLSPIMKTYSYFFLICTCYSQKQSNFNNGVSLRGYGFLWSPVYSHTCDIRVLHQQQESIPQSGTCCFCSGSKHVSYSRHQVFYGKLRLWIVLFLGFMWILFWFAGILNRSESKLTQVVLKIRNKQ